MKASGDQQLLKRINRCVLLRLIRAEPKLSRADLSRQSGLTKSTVSALVRELLDEHWIAEAPLAVVAEGMGRPATPLCINTQVRVLIGVEIAVECLRVVCVSLEGEVRSHIEMPLTDLRPEAVCDVTATALQRVCATIAGQKWQLCGLGVCLPGAITDDSGRVRFAPNLGWRDVAFLPMLANTLFVWGLPPMTLYLQNDADTAALSEYEFTAPSAGESDNGPLIFISCDVGVGAGIVLNDCLFTGASGTAGEIGHTTLQHGGPKCSCGRSGCAEAFIGARALQTEAGQAQAGLYLGVLIQNLDLMFNPRVIVLGGKSCINKPALVAAALATLANYAQQAQIPVPTVRVARYGLLAAAVGAAALVLHRYLRPASPFNR